MPECLNDGSVIFSRTEIKMLDEFTNRVDVLQEQYQQLKNQFEQLENINLYLVTCRDAFEAENKSLRKQIEIDQFSQICKIDNEIKKHRVRWL